MSNKASKEAANSLNGMQQLDLSRIPNPETVDYNDIIRQGVQSNYNNLPMNFATANRVNQFNVNQLVRGASTIQPYFKQNQEIIGRNAASMARGELPGDVTSSIGRAAASRGFANGIGMGSRGGGFNTALGNLNLRNLGLTSLDLSKFGTGVAMQSNQNAASMVPNLFDVQGQMISPALGVGSAFQNAGIVNRWNEANTAIANAEASGNTELLNSILEAQTGLRLQGQLQQAQAIQSASSTVSGLAGSGAFGGMGGATGAAGGGGFAGAGAGGQAGGQNRYLI